MHFLSKVEYAFTVPTRGCVVLPVDFNDPESRVSVGDAIQLRTSSGFIDGHIIGIEMIKQRSGPSRVGFLLSKEIDKSQISQEAEIWIYRLK
jgi:hypothetical protein